MERNFRVDLFSRVIYWGFFTFRVYLISQIGYRWIFREDLFSRILILSMFLYILIFSWFVLQLIVYESITAKYLH